MPSTAPAAQPGLDRAEARDAGRLAERRKPARAEVDRVELQAERGAGLVVGALEVGRGRRLRGSVRAYASIASSSIRTARGAATRALAARISSVRLTRVRMRPDTLTSVTCPRPGASVLCMPADAAIDALLEGLNPPQRDAVTHGEGPLLILAGAGSGKTRVLTHRIAYLMRTGQARAERDPRDHVHQQGRRRDARARRAARRPRDRAMWVMTFHSACARMLRADAHRLGYTRQFTIYDSADQRRLIKKCLDDLGVDAKRFTPRAMQSQISDAKNRLRSPEDYRELVGS